MKNEWMKVRGLAAYLDALKHCYLHNLDQDWYYNCSGWQYVDSQVNKGDFGLFEMWGPDDIEKYTPNYGAPRVAKEIETLDERLLMYAWVMALSGVKPEDVVK